MPNSNNNNQFIGLEALTTVAEQVGSQIVMGPAFANPDLLKRMRIKVISGVQYKQTETLLVRKGGTTRRKVVGQPMNNTIGFLKSRTLVAKLAWNKFRGNTSEFTETNFGVHATGSYPVSTEATEAILKTYAEDLLSNLFFGDINNEEVAGKEMLSLYDGFHTYIAQDVADGYISTVNKNLIECDSIVAPTDKEDSSPFDTVLEVYSKLSPALRKQKEILCYCDVLRGIYIADGYNNKKHGNADVVRKEDGTFTIPEMPRVTFVPEDVFGLGDRIIFTIPENFQYGVDTLNNQTKVRVKVGSDDDLDDVIFQIQSIQGTRVLNPLASAFAMTNGNITENVLGGDYQNSKLTVTVNETEGSVTVNGEAYDADAEYAPNAVIALKATAQSGYTFVGWSNGKTDAEISIVATGMPMAITALFEKNA